MLFDLLRAAPLFELAPEGVYPADGHPPTRELLPHDFTLACASPARTHRTRGIDGHRRCVSVALSLESPRVAVNDLPALWSPDFPPAGGVCPPAIPCPPPAGDTLGANAGGENSESLGRGPSAFNQYLLDTVHMAKRISRKESDGARRPSRGAGANRSAQRGGRVEKALRGDAVSGDASKAEIPRPGAIFDPVARALEWLGDKWTLVVVRHLLLAP